MFLPKIHQLFYILCPCYYIPLFRISCPTTFWHRRMASSNPGKSNEQEPKPYHDLVAQVTLIQLDILEKLVWNVFWIFQLEKLDGHMHAVGQLHTVGSTGFREAVGKLSTALAASYETVLNQIKTHDKQPPKWTNFRGTEGARQLNVFLPTLVNSLSFYPRLWALACFQ